MPLCELYDLTEARRLSEESLDGPIGWEGFTMPRANAMADLVQTAILQGDFATAEGAWARQWEDSLKTRGWARWLIPCRLAAARSELALAQGADEEALEWARKTVELCVPSRRLKYEAVGRSVLGQVLLSLGEPSQALSELRLAVQRADELGSPAHRWKALAALGKALYVTGDDSGAEAAYLAADQVRDVLAKVRV